MQPISNTAKAVLIDYLGRAAVTHNESIDTLAQDLQENISGFIHDFCHVLPAGHFFKVSINRKYSSSLFVAVSVTGPDKIAQEAGIFLSAFDAEKPLSTYRSDYTDTGRAATALMERLMQDAECVEYLRAVAVQYRTEYRPAAQYKAASEALQKSMLD
jgi:hypothetical protein